MKYVVIIGDGMADRPLAELGGKTPLQVAFTPNMDKLAQEGIRGVVRTVPQGMSPGSDVANLSILGYDPAQYYTGRAPLEAASIGVEMRDDDVAYRCNLVTLKYNKEQTRAVMEDYSAGHITTTEAAELINAVNAQLGSEDLQFFPGVSYRHLMLWHKGETSAECTPPHDITGKEITDYLPLGAGGEYLATLMRRSVDILSSHEVNKKRAAEGKGIANSIWLWGQGRKPRMSKFRDKFGIDGALVSAVDLTKGLGICAGLDVLKVPNVTGYLDTNYVGKAEYSLEALEKVDFVYIHVEAPDEAGHMGKLKEKIKAIEDFDALVVGTVMRGLRAFDGYRVLVMPDHPTPIELRTHTADPVPFILFDSKNRQDNPGATYDESILTANGAVRLEKGHELMDFLISGALKGGH